MMKVSGLMRLSILILIVIGLPIAVLADSDGYYSAGPGVLVYEQWLSDPDNIYIVAFGDQQDISDPVKFRLPEKITMNVQSFEIKDNRIVVVLRDLQRKNDETGKFITVVDELSFITIDITSPGEPKLVNTVKKPSSKDLKLTPPEDNLGLWSKQGSNRLVSRNPGRTYELIFNVRKLGTKKISPRTGIIYYEHETLITEKDSKGVVLKEKKIFKGKSEETYD